MLPQRRAIPVRHFPNRNLGPIRRPQGRLCILEVSSAGRDGRGVLQLVISVGYQSRIDEALDIKFWVYSVIMHRNMSNTSMKDDRNMPLPSREPGLCRLSSQSLSPPGPPSA